ncbi:MAG: NADH-quinone oxidoreductase subunit J [Deltaproteobacteria bacterium]|nr:NADH-quinone oxidoreductase subunit J [Deltaproteobacteria bacterium]
MLFKILFYIVSLGIIGLSLFTALSRNIVRSVFALLGVMIGIACLYGILGSGYLAVIQIMIYVGGIMVLFIFAVMFTSKIEDVGITNRSFGRIQALLISGAIFIMFTFLILFYPFEGASTSNHQSVERIGKVISTDYLPFLIGIAVILLISLIGAITIARPKKE